MKALVERFNEKWTPEPFSGCSLWTGTTRGGYGEIMSGGTIEKAHRVAWKLAYGDIPRGQNVCHKCDTPSCVNPNHLFLGSQRQNRLDCVLKGRQARRERNGNAKLTQEQICKIRASEMSQRQLASVFRTAQSNIWQIKKRKTWK